MVTTIPTDTEGGSSQAMKNPSRKEEEDGPANVNPGPEAPVQYGDLAPLSNPPAGGTRLDSTSPLNSLRKFAGTPQQRKRSSGDGSNSSPGAEESRQSEEPNTNGELKPVPHKSALGDSKAREARSKMGVEDAEEQGEADKKKEVSVPQTLLCASSKDDIPDNIRAKFGSIVVEELVSNEQIKSSKPSNMDGDKRRASSAHPAKKRDKSLDKDGGKRRASSAHRAEECSPKAGVTSRRDGKCNSTSFEVHEIKNEKSSSESSDLDGDEEKEAPTEAEENMVQVVRREEMTQEKQENPDLNMQEEKAGCISTQKSYQELGQCLRANIFPGIPVTRKSLVQESYTTEVNQRGKVEKSKSNHWHGKKSDELGHWHERNFSNLNLQRAMEEKNKDKLKKN